MEAFKTIASPQMLQILQSKPKLIKLIAINFKNNVTRASLVVRTGLKFDSPNKKQQIIDGRI